jgi:hypothetical protein
MAASILAGLLGSLIGAIFIAGAVFVAFKLFRFDTPRFPNLWKAAFLASAVVVVASAVGAALLGDGLLGSLAILGAALVGAFIAYEKTLETADGELMGSKAAAVALGAHSVFSTLSFLFVFPLVMGALT